MNFITKLIKTIKASTPPSLAAVTDDENKLDKNIANYGMLLGQYAIREGGEYDGLTIKAEEVIRPLITNNRIIRALEFIQEEKLFEASRVLNLDEVTDYGFDLIYYVLDKWLTKANIEIPQELIYNKNIKFDPIKKLKLDKWLNTTRSDPILGKIRVVGIGYSANANGPVVPEDWMDRVFESGADLHNAMNNLEWRIGKPPVSYCVCYFIGFHDLKTWESIPNFNANLSKTDDITLCMTIEFINSVLSTNIYEIKNNTEFLKYAKNFSAKNVSESEFKILQFSNVIDTKIENIVIIANVDKIFDNNNNYKKYENVGILVSRLQKCIRRGRKCANLLQTTISQLNDSKPYNLPEQQFVRVSGSKQLVWRLWISIIEDTMPYLPSPNNKYLSMQDLLCLAITCHVDPTLKFKKEILDQIIYTSVCVQAKDDVGTNLRYESSTQSESELRTNLTKILNTNPLKQNMIAFDTALRSLPMMGGDYDMLLDAISYFINNKEKEKDKDKDKNIKTLELCDLKMSISESVKLDEMRTTLASFDMHCCPYILLLLQSGLKKIPTEEQTTKLIANQVWNISSKLNVRNTKDAFEIKESDKEFYNLLTHVQAYLYDYDKYTKRIDANIIKKYITSNYKIKYAKPNPLTELQNRLGFMLIFGTDSKIKHKSKTFDVIICGDAERPCRIKKTNADNTQFLDYDSEERYILEQVYVETFKNKFRRKLVDPPVGMNWIDELNTGSGWITTRVELIESDPIKKINKLRFFINNIECKPFDSSQVLMPIAPSIPTKPNSQMLELINQLLYFEPIKTESDTLNHFILNLIAKQISYERLEQNDFAIYEWKSSIAKIPGIVWRSILMKINTCVDLKIVVGPVDRSGNKLQYAIHYVYEGTILRILNMLCMIYPRTIKSTKNELVFILDKKTPEYQHLINNITWASSLTDEKITIPKSNPKISTKLWDHQTNSVNKINDSLLKLGKRGMADASKMGSGKTLTSLAIIAKLMSHNITNKISTHYAAVIMVPTSKLYKTWKDEITKHTKGLEMVFQEANGDLTGKILFNTIIITTMGRMREHPLSIPWLFVVVDECLSVQNKNALQTAEAWRQVSNSFYGCLLLSATFFVSRIDKLYYMLKMLQTGLPEEREYLNAILSESIVCNIPAKVRDWISNTTKYDLETNIRSEYDKLLQQKLSSEQLYVALNKFIYDNVDYVDLFKQKIKEIEKKNKSGKILIFARSKEEADEISKEIKNVGRYPDISKRHVCASVAEAGYGVNELVICNIILCRPIHPDVLAQCKGRIDRPGQKDNKLKLELILLKDTIEEALLLVHELSERFRKVFIIPLADFYSVAVKRKNIKDII